MPSVDVLVPSYNYGRYLGDCVKSVLTQDGPELRVLIVDNASTDDSQEVARALAAGDSRVGLCLRERNLGPHASFNAGVDWARADYFLILCADDLLAPGALKKAVEIMERHGQVNLVYGRTEFVPPDFSSQAVFSGQSNEYEILPGPAFLERFCSTGRSPVGGPTTLVRTRAQKRAGHYAPALAHTDDVEMWMRFALLGAVARTESVQVLARIHEGNQSAVVSSVHHWNVEMERAFDLFFNGAGASLPDRKRLHRCARHSLASRAYWCAVSHFMRREPGVADLFRFALRVRPALAVLPPLGGLMTRDDALARIRATLKSALKLSPRRAASS